MAKEIERKFLVKGEFKTNALKCSSIIQAYISSNPDRSVRLRLIDNKAFLTIKGNSNSSGLCRYEWEKEIDYKEAKELILISEPGRIEKIRFLVPYGHHFYEVDEFHGQNQGLIIAEIELQSEDEHFERPEWLGDEVTNDERYYNSNLVRKPFCNW